MNPICQIIWNLWDKVRGWVFNIDLLNIAISWIKIPAAPCIKPQYPNKKVSYSLPPRSAHKTPKIIWYQNVMVCCKEKKNQRGNNWVVTLSVLEIEGEDELLNISYFKIFDLSEVTRAPFYVIWCLGQALSVLSTIHSHCVLWDISPCCTKLPHKSLFQSTQEVWQREAAQATSSIMNNSEQVDGDS